jgi:hypothetical protein
MPRVFSDQIAEDIDGLLGKYSTIQQDVHYFENQLRIAWLHSIRCMEFNPSWVLRTEVQISAFEGQAANNRCSIVNERDGEDCYLLLLFDNDIFRYDDVIALIKQRLGLAC